MNNCPQNNKKKTENRATRTLLVSSGVSNIFLNDSSGYNTLPVYSEEFEDTKWVIRIHQLKKNRQHNNIKKKYMWHPPC